MRRKQFRLNLYTWCQSKEASSLPFSSTFFMVFWCLKVGGWARNVTERSKICLMRVFGINYDIGSLAVKPAYGYYYFKQNRR